MINNQVELLRETRALEASMYAQGFHDGLRQALSIGPRATTLPTIEA